MNCLELWLDIERHRMKRALVNQNRHTGKLYPHGLITVRLQLATAFEYEVAKFARMWCTDDPVALVREVRAVKEIFEVENQDEMVSMIELLANKYAVG
jgi:hypothetical protein